MAMPQQDTRVRPSGWWYLVTVVLWIASLVVFIIAIKPVISIFSAGVDHIENHAPINVPSDGLTVYASAASGNPACNLSSPGGGRTIFLTPFDQADADNFTFTFDNGIKVHPLATTPDDTPAGRYILSCSGVPQSEVLAKGERLDFSAFAARLAIGVSASLLCGLAGLVWLIVMLVRRHNSKQRVRQAAASYGYGYGGYPPGSYPGYAQGGYPQGGYPQGGQPESGYPQSSPSSPPASQPPPPPPPAESAPPPSEQQTPDEPERRE
jgi:hypothetical protein